VYAPLFSSLLPSSLLPCAGLCRFEGGVGLAVLCGSPLVCSSPQQSRAKHRGAEQTTESERRRTAHKARERHDPSANAPRIGLHARVSRSLLPLSAAAPRASRKPRVALQQTESSADNRTGSEHTDGAYKQHTLLQTGRTARHERTFAHLLCCAFFSTGALSSSCSAVHSG
jgi:hypothetical protein